MLTLPARQLDPGRSGDLARGRSVELPPPVRPPKAIILDHVATSSPDAGAEGLRDVSLEIVPGKATLLTGPAGSGKSTLLALIAGYRRPAAGTIRLGDCEMTAMDDCDLAAIRNKTFRFYAPAQALVQELSLLEILLEAGAMAEEQANAKGRAIYLLSLIGLVSHARERLAALSPRQQDALAVARVLMVDAPIILADEPTTGGGPRAARRFSSWAEALARSGRSVVVASEDARLLGSSVFHTRAVLSESRLAGLRTRGAFGGRLRSPARV